MGLDDTTYYSILGLSPSATITDISKSYKNLARKFHPDKCLDQDTEDIFKLIVEAYSVLSDKEEKLKYDVALHRQVPQNQAYTNNIYKNKFQNRKSKPYEEQPYGFGFEQTAKPTSNNNNNNNKTNTTENYKSFNLKSFKRNQQQQDKNSMSSNEKTRYNTESNKGANADVNINNSENSNKSGGSAENNYSTDQKDDNDATNDDEKDDSGDNQRKENNNSNDDEEEFPRKPKLHKSEASGANNLNMGNGDNRSFNNYSNWNFNHKRYIRIRNEQKNTFNKDSKQSTNDMKNDPFSLNEEYADSIRDLIDKMNNIDKNKMRPSYSDNNADNANGDNSETKSNNDSGNNSKRKANEHSPSFNMDNINDSINDIPMNKKMKIDDASLYDPVNQTLPRIYKNETIDIKDFEIDSRILQLGLPKSPNFNINSMDALALQQCKQEVIYYNEEVNKLKQFLVAQYTKRIVFNMNHMEPLVKLENQTNWIQSCQYDIALIAQLQQLENEQIMVALQWQSISRENVTSI